MFGEIVLRIVLTRNRISNVRRKSRLARLGVIKIVSKGKAGSNSKEAAELRYLLSQIENGPGEEDGVDF